MTADKDALIAEIANEGLQMSIESHAAAMIIFNARLQMVADAIGLDISEPELSEAEEKNKNLMLESVGKRLVRIMTLAAQSEGAEPPTNEECAAALEAIQEEVWPTGSVSGRASSTEPNTSAAPSACQPVLDAIEKQNGGKVISTTVPSDIDDELATRLAEAITEAEPIADPSELFKGSVFEDAEPVFTEATPEKLLGENELLQELDFKEADDTTVEEDTVMFKSSRAVSEPVTFALTVHAFGDNDGEGFPHVDFEDPDSRTREWQSIVRFYTEEAEAAFNAGYISEAWFERYAQELFNIIDEDFEITSELELPEPGAVSDGILQTVAAGEDSVEITGLTSQEQVVEALMVSFMVTASRYNSAIGRALLESRLEAMGMKA